MYAVYYKGCCEEHGGPEMTFYDTLEQAKLNATDSEYILKVVKEGK